MNTAFAIPESLPELETIFSNWQEVIGEDLPGYRNHVYRMYLVALQLHLCNEEEQRKLLIAAAFHDIGIWIEDTVDYIEPSVPPALAYLEQQGLSDWAEEISLMIREHHKITPYKDPRFPLVELFRKADLVDFSGGLLKAGLDKEYFRELCGIFPNNGFHKMLLKRTGRWFIRHTLNPAPMMKW